MNRLKWVIIISLFCMCTASAIYGEDFKSQFKDPEDGAFDISLWMSNAYGFIPILSLITEPALGYGLFGGVLFVHMDKEAMLRSEEKPQSISAAGGLTSPHSLVHFQS
jgi:hypothetical protein